MTNEDKALPMLPLLQPTEGKKEMDTNEEIKKHLIPLTEPQDEPDLHDVGPTPLADLGVPDPDEISEAQWLEKNS